MTSWHSRKLGKFCIQCFPKICSKLCGLKPESNVGRPRYERGHNPLAGGQRKVRGFINRQRARKEATRPYYGRIAGRASERSRVDGYQRRMWPGRVWLVL